MAFENVRLTLDEIEEFEARKIKNPYGSAQNIVEGISPSYVTIDKETNTWLTWCYRHRDMDEDFEEFLFMYKEIPIPLQVIFSYEKSKDEVSWEVTRLNVPDELIDEKEQIKSLITTAFETYNATGRPEQPKEKTKVICKFRKGV